MSDYRIAWLPGDGVGVDVMEATRIVLDAVGFSDVAEYRHGDIGWKFWCEEGDPLPQRTLDLLADTDVCLFGAITSKPKDEAAEELTPRLRGQGLSYFSPIVRLRQELGLHTNLRPCKGYPGNPLNYKDDIDLVVFRENTEGLYAGVEFTDPPEEVLTALGVHPKFAKFADVPGPEMAISTRIVTKAGCTSIARQAFQYAKLNEYKTVTLVEKPNVLRETGGMMTDAARAVAAEYDGIDLWETNIDAMCMWLVKNPHDYGVIMAENMFGDIISDLCAQLVGGLGFACAGNIGDDYAVFEPTHGSAPKYAGQYKVNPIATILTAKMMIAWLGHKRSNDPLLGMASRIEAAAAWVIKDGKVRTYDMGGSNTTIEMAEAVAARL